jgi:hypothetical protein
MASLASIGNESATLRAETSKVYELGPRLGFGLQRQIEKGETMKRIIGITITVLLIFAGTAHAQTAVRNTEGSVLKHTCRITVGDTATYLTSLIETALSDAVEWSVVEAVTLTCETNDVRVAFGADPTQGASGLGHIIFAMGGAKWVSNNKIRGARLIAKTNGATGYCQATLEY